MLLTVVTARGPGPRTQDGRKLRRYKRRWKVERFFAWLQNFRKVVVRYERHDYNFAAFVKLGCIVILLRACFEMTSSHWSLVTGHSLIATPKSDTIMPMLSTWPAAGKRLSNLAILGALLGALLVVVFALYAPVPRQLSGEEDLTGAQMPSIRASVEAAQSPFLQAQRNYLDYVATHDVSADLTVLEQAIAAVRDNPSDGQALSRLRDAAAPVKAYMDLLLPYAQAGEPYFSQLRGYDDSLMGWSRSLGSRLEDLKVKTRPIADYLRLYPPPVGDLSADPPWMTAAQVEANKAALDEHIASLNTAISAGGKPGGDLASLFASDLENVKASGHSIERIESLHNDYYKTLATYDGQVADVVGSPAQTVSPPGGWAVANGLNLGLGLVILAGVFALFVPGRKQKDAVAGS